MRNRKLPRMPEDRDLLNERMVSQPRPHEPDLYDVLGTIAIGAGVTTKNETQKKETSK